MRGEHSNFEGSLTVFRGSSPHARGAPLWHPVPHQKPWIIPACAGSTRRLVKNASESWDHPRMRGEHERCESRDYWRRGSSPHARGALAAG